MKKKQIMKLQPLSHSSVVDLVAPGSPPTGGQMWEAVKRVESLGFRARLPEVWSKSGEGRCLSSTHKGQNGHKGRYLPGQELKDVPSFSRRELSKKFHHLKQALTAKDSEAVWCIRGGYGSQKLMPFLMKMKKPARPKIFIGYSDVTVIQTFLNLKWGWPVLHFPVLVDLKDCSFSALKRFQQLVRGKVKEQSFSGLRVLNRDVAGPGFTKKVGRGESLSASVEQKKRQTRRGGEREIHSFLTGGNLTLIQSSVATSYAGDFKNKILFLEDTGEAPYRLSRALWHMSNAGVFKGIKALVLGDFIYTKNSERASPTTGAGSASARREIKKVFQAFAESVPFPVVEGVPCGHGKKKEALPFLTPCALKLHADGKATLRCASPFTAPQKN